MVNNKKGMILFQFKIGLVLLLSAISLSVTAQTKECGCTCHAAKRHFCKEIEGNNYFNTYL
jgi:hypothetical protein